ncbi:chromate resistance protein ChrB domain-containing protein [Rhizorhabdus wittichii]|uniref:chromate resistance protein ChrB domain-containing protein n=1 Tax=Rhizorhabdus wittichii TaxID=160791 RepID=UPI0002E91617|nr:sulfurtransferase/chromate resistance protein [Rhizorhabdus wittichii]
MPALNSISVDRLARLIGTPSCPALIDLRAGIGDDRLIPGSIPRRAAEVSEWGGGLAGRAAVIIDEDGGPLSEGVAAWLRSDGIAAEILGGGHAAWRNAGQPLVRTGCLPSRQVDGRTLWVTRARPKVDRIACPWLIRRFVDPGARFLFVVPGEVMAVAERLDATPFDFQHDAVFWSHRGERCTFDVMVEEFGLGALPALAYLAEIVRGADTGRPDLVPEAAGLVALSLGLSRLHADDDRQLEAGLPIYDALYRWCRDARAETHDWDAHKPREARP